MQLALQDDAKVVIPPLPRPVGSHSSKKPDALERLSGTRATNVSTGFARPGAHHRFHKPCALPFRIKRGAIETTRTGTSRKQTTLLWPCKRPGFHTASQWDQTDSVNVSVYAVVTESEAVFGPVHALLPTPLGSTSWGRPPPIDSRIQPAFARWDSETSR